MAKIDRYNGNVRAFAADSLGTERTVFGATTQSDTLDGNITLDLLRGWGIVGVNENPTKQDFNGLAFTLGQLLAYLHQRGVPEWNSAQEYYQGSVVTTLAGVYRLLNGGDGSVNPDTDAGANWELAPTRTEVDLLAPIDAPVFTGVPEADTAALGTSTKQIATTEFVSQALAGIPLTGTATFTNSTNNIALTGIGSIGLEIGDVVQVTDTASNNKLFTVEVITDDDNVVVNQAHAGGTTIKSLVNETVSATVTLVSKWFSAAYTLGQGTVDQDSVRSAGVTYTNNTGRVLTVYTTLRDAGAGFIEYLIDGDVVGGNNVASSMADDTDFTNTLIVPMDATYKIIVLDNQSKVEWWEIR
jgi:hypothetical protein